MTEYETNPTFEELQLYLNEREKKRVLISTLIGLVAGIAFTIYAFSTLTEDTAGPIDDSFGFGWRIVAGVLIFVLPAYTVTAMVYGSGRVERYLRAKHIIGQWSFAGNLPFMFLMFFFTFFKYLMVIFAGGAVYMYKLPYIIICLIGKKPIVGKGLTYEELVEFGSQHSLGSAIIFIAFAAVVFKASPLGNGELEATFNNQLSNRWKTPTEYLTSLSDLDKDTLETINQNSKEKISDFWLNLEGKLDDLHGLNYAGSILLSKKDDAGKENETNILYMIYQVDCSWEGVEYPHYVYAKHTNVGFNRNGDYIHNKEDCQLTENKWKPTGSNNFYYFGYGTFEDLYNLEIEPLTEKYTVEKNMVE